MADLDAIFKAYDIRGTTPDQLDADVARALGEAFAVFVAGPGGRRPQVLVGRDMRPSGVELAAAFADGVRAQGLDVVDLGLASTDLVYFAAGKLDAPAAMFTASHNPAQYNGVKLCLAGARPIGEDSGLVEIKAMAAAGVPPPTGPPAASSRSTCSAPSPTTSARSSTSPRCARSRSWPTPPTAWAASWSRRCSTGLPVDLEVLYGELDGTFPNHPADPIQPENLRDLQARVLEVGADVGLAFDGDADRVFLVDEHGRAALGLHHHRDRRGRRAREAPGRHDPAQLHLLQGRARGRARARRHAGAHQGRAQLHQGGDGRHRRRVRRRALRPLLLPRQLAGRLRLDRRPHGARAARQGRRAALRAAPALRPLRRLRRDQLRGSTTRRR